MVLLQTILYSSRLASCFTITRLAEQSDNAKWRLCYRQQEVVGSDSPQRGECRHSHVCIVPVTVYVIHKVDNPHEYQLYV
jgi:hypothetical protein